MSGDYLRTCWCDGATYEDDDGVLRCWECTAPVADARLTPPDSEQDR